jgi:integrase
VAGHTADIGRGVWVDPQKGRITLEEYSTRWIDQRTDLRPRTEDDYRDIIRVHIAPKLGDEQLCKLTPGDVRSWYATLSAKVPGRARKAYRLLRAILNTAVADEIIVRNPCRVRGAGQDRSAERPIATVAQVAALADAVDQRLRALVLLAGWCGLRRAELLALRRRDVDVLHTTVRVERSMHTRRDNSIVIGPPKTDAGRRTVAIPPHIVADLEHHLGTYVAADADSLLFTERAGGPLRLYTVERAWRKARTAVGVEQLRLHDLRHTGNTLAAATGASTKELMARMGHASPQAALIYQHATADRDRAIADALSDLAAKAEVGPIRRRRDLTPDSLGHVQVTPDPQTSPGTVQQAFDLDFSQHPQRDSNPCCRLERDGQGLVADLHGCVSAGHSVLGMPVDRGKCERPRDGRAMCPEGLSWVNLRRRGRSGIGESPTASSWARSVRLGIVIVRYRSGLALSGMGYSPLVSQQPDREGRRGEPGRLCVHLLASSAMGGPSNTADFDPDSPWPPMGVAEFPRDKLEEILRSNYGVDIPADADAPRLRTLLNELQRNPPLQGTMRWVKHNDDELVLYEPERARLARRVEELAVSIRTWGDLRVAVADGNEVAELLIDDLDLLWERGHYWAFGLEDYEPRIEQAESFQTFMAMAPQNDTLEISLENDGEPTLWICDPMDPGAMGIPPVIVDRYYEEQSNMISSWSSVPTEALPNVRRTLLALGWDLEEGSRTDLPGG